MNYADVLQTITAVATALGLVLVIISLQQARRSINAATYQHILEREAENWNQVRVGDIAVRVRSLQHFGIIVDEKSYNDEMDVLIANIGLFDFYEGIFFLQRQGAINKEVWQNW